MSDSTQERFDQNSFLGRWAKMLYDCDPSTLLTSSSAVIKSTRKLHVRHMLLLCCYRRVCCR